VSYVFHYRVPGADAQSSKRNRRRLPGGKLEAPDFDCPEDFGYYAHYTDCSKYYVCVFGGALLESCTGGLLYRYVPMIRH
jgi:predicted enzyme related to lactoylglutathione lyase